MPHANARRHEACWAFQKENVMRPCLLAACVAYLPLAALAASAHTIRIINDKRVQIVSFSVAPAGSSRWVEFDFKDEPFGYEVAKTLTFRDDDGCLRDLRTVLSDGREVMAHNFDVCHDHVYWPGMTFHDSHGVR
jgi:hypothetical protein